MLSVQLPPEGAGRIACRVIRAYWAYTVLAFHHRAAVQVVPVVGRLSGLSARRSPVEAMRSVGFFVALAVKERRAGVLWRPFAGVEVNLAMS